MENPKVQKDQTSSHPSNWKPDNSDKYEHISLKKIANEYFSSIIVEQNDKKLKSENKWYNAHFKNSTNLQITAHHVISSLCDFQYVMYMMYNPMNGIYKMKWQKRLFLS